MLSRWGVRRAASLLAVNLAILAIGIGGLEVAARSRDFGSLGAALRSFVRPEPSRFGTLGRRAKWLVTDPDLGYRLNPNAETVNTLGIRHPEITTPKPPNRYRVVVVGDSVSWDADGFVTRMRDRLQAPRGVEVEVINAAIPGYTTYQERVLLERDLLALEPDLVLVQYCLNDNHRFLHYVDPAGHWLVTEEAMAWLAVDGNGLLAWLTRSSALVRQLRLGLAQPTVVQADAFLAPQNEHFGPAWHDGPWAATAEHLVAMRDASRAHNAAFAIVMAPIREQMIESWLERAPDHVLEPQRRMAELAKREQIPLLDLHPSFRGNAPEELFRDPLHFTARGHEIAGTAILEFLRRNRLGPGA